MTIFFFMLRKFSIIISSNIFSGLFCFSSSTRTPIIKMLFSLMLSQTSLRLSSFFSFFFLYSVLWQRFSPFCLPSHLSILLPVIQLLIPSNVFCICYCLVHPVCLFFSLFILFVCSSFVKLLLYLLDLGLCSFPEILDHLSYHYSEFFFR